MKQKGNAELKTAGEIDKENEIEYNGTSNKESREEPTELVGI